MERAGYMHLDVKALIAENIRLRVELAGARDVGREDVLSLLSPEFAVMLRDDIKGPRND